MIGAAPVDPWASALALITDTKGWALDPTNSSLVFDDTARTVPATVTGQAAAIVSASSATGFLGQVTSTSFEPVWNGLSLFFDGTDDYVSNQAGYTSDIQSWMNNVSGLTLCMKFRLNAVGVINTLINLSTTANSTLSGFALVVTAANELNGFVRRTAGDGSTGSAVTSGLGLTTGVDYVATMTVDFANGPMNIRLNGASANSGTWPGTSPSLGNTTAANPLVHRIGRNLSNANPASAYIGRVVGLPYLATAGQITTLEAGVGATALL